MKFFISKAKETQEYEKKIPHIKKAINIMLRAVEIHKNDQYLANFLGKCYGYLSRCYLFTNDIKLSIKFAHLGKERDSTLNWINTNLIISYVLTNKNQEAENLYFQYKNKFYSSFLSFDDRIHQLIDEMEERGIDEKSINKLRRFLERY